jgi:predicted esterase
MKIRPERTSGPHSGASVVVGGAPLASAQAVLILAHGRGGRAIDLMALADAVIDEQVAALLPQAIDYTWYPHRFIAPLADNEPWLSSALAAVDDLVAQVAEAGIPSERVVLAGFSQGACLVLEYAARHARRYGGVAGLSGGLIGPDGQVREPTGSLQATPILLACSDIDAHIPIARVRQSAEVMRSLGGAVDLRIYPGMGHVINDDEVAALRAMVANVISPAPSS